MTYRGLPMSPHWSRMIAWALALPLAAPLQPAHAASALSFISSPYSWIGLGETVNAGPDEGFSLSVQGEPSAGLVFTIANPWTPDDSFRYWNLHLAPPQGASLAVGSYSNATRWPFQEETVPGLEFSGNYRANNWLTGSFDILELEYDADGTLSFAADFLQYDEEDINRWTKGALRYNSELPVSLTPEPIIADLPVDLGYIIDPPFDLPSFEVVIDPLTYETFPFDRDEWPYYYRAFSSGSSMEIVPILSYNTEINHFFNPVPGPLPIVGVLAGWRSSRRLRRRCREGSQRGSLAGGFPHS
ncbi:MAG: hypothetical protein ACK52U_16935 [Synechococcaceae cyanobacterium]